MKFEDSEFERLVDDRRLCYKIIEEYQNKYTVEVTKEEEEIQSWLSVLINSCKNIIKCFL